MTVCTWNKSNKHFFDWQQKKMGIKGNPYNFFFMIKTTDLCTFRNLDIWSAFCSKQDHTINTNTNTRIRTASTLLATECWIIIIFTIFFVHFIYPYMNPLPLKHQPYCNTTSYIGISETNMIVHWNNFLSNADKIKKTHC